MSPSSKSSVRQGRAVDGWPPRWLTKPKGRKTRGPEVRAFIGAYCRATKDTIAAPAGELLSLRPWQSRLIDALYAERTDGLLRYRQGLIGMPRKNGKTAIGAGIGLHGLFLGPAGGEVYSVAGDKEQARICFGMARRMVELDPELSGITKIYRDALEHLDSGSIYRVLSSDAPLKEGLSPTLVIFDEVHVQPDADLWSVMNLGSGARHEAQVLGITTAGAKRDTAGDPSLCFGLYEYGISLVREQVDDERFFFAWWEPRAGLDADYRDPNTWREANPGFDDIVAAEDFEANLPPKVPEHEFITKRTNVWRDATVSNWLADAPGAWSACRSDLTLADGWNTVAAVDMSLRHDTTAVSVVGKVGDRIVTTSRVFRAPLGGKIDFGEVFVHLRRIAEQFHVRAICYDPRFLEYQSQQLADEGLPMQEFPQSDERMVPACGHLRDLIVGGTLAHDDDPDVNDQVLAAVWRDSERGRRLSKGKSRRPIDASITLAMACWELGQDDEYDVLDSVR